MSNKVLICHDEENIREMLKLILGDEYELFLVGTSTQAIYTLENSKDIKAILLDIKMVNINDIDVKKMKIKFPNVNIILIMGYRSKESGSEDRSIGTTEVISKPFKSEEILETVRRSFLKDTQIQKIVKKKNI